MIEPRTLPTQLAMMEVLFLVDSAVELCVGVIFEVLFEVLVTKANVVVTTSRLPAEVMKEVTDSKERTAGMVTVSVLVLASILDVMRTVV